MARERRPCRPRNQSRSAGGISAGILRSLSHRIAAGWPAGGRRARLGPAADRRSLRCLSSTINRPPARLRRRKVVTFARDLQGQARSGATVGLVAASEAQLAHACRPPVDRRARSAGAPFDKHGPAQHQPPAPSNAGAELARRPPARVDLYDAPRRPPPNRITARASI
jgi:hypothetical protein